MRVLQGLGGGPLIPIAQAVLWEIFPPRQRGMAMAVWGLGIVLAPTFGPTVGGWIADNWSWRWIFYINLPIGVLGIFMASAFLFDSPHTQKSARLDLLRPAAHGAGVRRASSSCSTGASARTGSTRASSARWPSWPSWPWRPS